MKISRRRRGLKAVVAVLLILFGLVFLVSRIDRAEPLTAGQMVLKLGAVEIDSDSTIDLGPYADYLKVSAKPPEDYVVEKFRTHDVVLLGEAHQIREDCELIERLIEPLYHRAGVNTLAMEIVKAKRTEEINRWLIAPSCDEARLVQIFREDYFYWGFQEYLNILKSVWKFNHSRATGEEPFRVMGIQPDMNIFDVDCGSLPAKVLQFPKLLRMEELYAQPILAKVLEQHQKVLVQVGYFHTFQNYRQPKVIDGKMYGEVARVRMGQLLKEKLGDRVFQISMHVSHGSPDRYSDSLQTPVLRLLERLYGVNGNVPIGFDIIGSPFAMLRDTCSWLFRYQKHVTLSDMAQGYILQAPFEELHAVKWVDGFVNASNFEHLRTYALQRQLMTENEGRSPEALQHKLSSLLDDRVRFP
jgi:hypothetical protein